jgi:hypothetical protein
MNRPTLVALSGALALASPALAQAPAGPATTAGRDLSAPPAPQPPGREASSLALKAPELAAAARPAPPKNYWVPVLEITGWNIIQNRWSYYFGDTAVYDVSWETWKYNLQHWWWDSDQFSTNGFAHPYMGNLYFNMARSHGLDFWVSAGYAFGGSLMWEYFGETEPPSVNDQITTPWGGTVLGEVLFRLANRVLDGGGARPGFWRKLGALALNPAHGFNRILYGDKYRPAGLNTEPFHSEFRLSLGVLGERNEAGAWEKQGRPVSFSTHLVNGVPGSDWAWRRPFDYFDVNFNITLNKDSLQASGFMTFLLRGAVLAAMYGEAPSRGLWGLYFNYDYIAPSIYRVESANLGLGTTGQVDWGAWAFQGHALLGLGFGAGGSASDADVQGNRDYHFGGQVTLNLEGHFFHEDSLRLGLRAREYVTGGKITDQHQAMEDVTYATASVLWRFIGRHGVGVEGIVSRRRATYPDVPDVKSRVSGLTLFYEFLGDAGLGRGR